MLSILIVEDDITFSLMLTTWLGKKGFVVRSSSSVSDAKRRLGEEAFDLVISDLRLPDSDGIDLLKWLKSTHIKHGIFNPTDKSSAYCKASSGRCPITGPHESYYCRTLGGPYG